MPTNAIRTLRNHWETLRNGHDLPLRSEINPCVLPNVLDSLFILERLNPSDIRVRIAGLTICEMIGMEVRGQSPSTFFDSHSRGRFKAVVSDVMDRPVVARLGLDMTDKLGNRSAVEMILLPLRSDFGDVSRIIGCVTVQKKMLKAPVQFRLRVVDLEPISQSTATNPATIFGFSEPKAGFSMDGAPSFRTITGSGDRQPRAAVNQDYLKVVD